MGLVLYPLASLLIGALAAYFLPRTAIIAGSVLLLISFFFIGSCVFHEIILTTPHDTSAYGMMATISALTILPAGAGMVVAGLLRKRMV